VQAIDILVSIHRQEGALFVETARQRQLHQVGVDRRICIESPDRRQQVGLAHLG
jgi:hypothetical protein